MSNASNQNRMNGAQEWPEKAARQPQWSVPAHSDSATLRCSVKARIPLDAIGLHRLHPWVFL